MRLTGRVIATAPCEPPAGLSRTATEPEALAAWRRDAGVPAGIRDLLSDLDRTARPARLRRTRAAMAFRWDTDDSADPGWMPQGVACLDGAYFVSTSNGRVGPRTPVGRPPRTWVPTARLRTAGRSRGPQRVPVAGAALVAE